MWNRFLPSRRVTPRSTPNRTTRPSLEGLEERLLLYAATGDQWVNPQRVTYSFMPDGTNVGGATSTLFQTMNKAATTATWELQFRKAAAIWEAVANVQLVEVPDNGAPVGSTGDQQGDPHFGDIRIGAVPEQSGTLALTFFPPPDNGGTLAGDMFFNSNVNWQVNTGYDIETVALHELGHALGMDHSQVQQAIMYASYTGIKQTPNSDDIAGIDSVYGGVPSASGSNTSISTATNITPYINANSQIALGGLELVSSSDQDYFKVAVPASTTGTMTVSVQSTDLSSLAPRVTVYNSNGSGLAQATNSNGFGTTATVTISNVSPGQVYYIRAISANTGGGSVGTYGLLVNFGSQTQAQVAPPNTTVASTSSSTTSGTSGAETTSSTSTSSGLLGGLLGLVGGLLEIVGSVLGNIVTIGSVSGVGDALTVSPAYARAHHLEWGNDAVQPHEHHHHHHGSHTRAHHHADRPSTPAADRWHAHLTSRVIGGNVHPL